MLHKNVANPLSPHSSDYYLANEFSNFFKEKIQSIQDFLDNPQRGGTNSRWQDQPKYTTKLTEFKPISEEEVMEIVTKSPNNISLQIGDMPKILKKAIITHLIKKLGIELINKNYRPVFNLDFLSKRIEGIVAIQLMNHITVNNLTYIFQSAYRKGHSIETAFLKVQNDILMER